MLRIGSRRVRALLPASLLPHRRPGLGVGGAVPTTVVCIAFRGCATVGVENWVRFAKKTDGTKKQAKVADKAPDSVPPVDETPAADSPAAGAAEPQKSEDVPPAAAPAPKDETAPAEPATPSGTATDEAAKQSDKPADKPVADKLADKPVEKKSSDARKDEKKNKDGDGEGENEDEDFTLPIKLRGKVIGVAVLCGVLYYMSWPAGENTSDQALIAAIMENPSAVTAINIYERYVQVYFEGRSPMHVGVVNTEQAARIVETIKIRSALVDQPLEGKVNYVGKAMSERALHIVSMLIWIVPFVFLPIYSLMLTRFIAEKGGPAGGRGGGSKVKSQMFSLVKEEKTRFGDVAGMFEVKREVTEFVHFLKDAEKFQRLGARIPNGALLLGPPGTGKTLLAKAVAGEAGVSFISCSGSDFVELYVGMGALRVRELFKLARKQRKCIIFIDEIDAIGTARSGNSGGASQERESTLNELLAQLDGFSKKEGQVMVLGSTNAPLDMLDPALTRPGRFDRLIQIDRPTINERIEIFNVHLSKIKLGAEEVKEDIAKRMSELCPGFVGADVANICNEAAILGARERKDAVTVSELERSVDRVLAGIEHRCRVLSPFEKRVVAYHEAGHAVAGWFLELADPLMKVSIVPRGGKALGYAQYLPNENHVHTSDEIVDSICVALGGRVAELEFFQHYSTGASDDLDKVTKMAYMHVSSFNHAAFPSPGSGTMTYTKPYSPKRANDLDVQAKALVDKAFAKTVALIHSRREDVERLAQRLMQNEILTYADVVELLGTRKERTA